jgi:hypothetical protein
MVRGGPAVDLAVPGSLEGLKNWAISVKLAIYAIETRPTFSY